MKAASFIIPFSPASFLVASSMYCIASFLINQLPCNAVVAIVCCHNQREFISCNLAISLIGKGFHHGLHISAEGNMIACPLSVLYGKGSREHGQVSIQKILPYDQFQISSAPAQRCVHFQCVKISSVLQKTAS